MSPSQGKAPLRLEESFPAESVRADGSFTQLDACATEAPRSLVYCQNQHYLTLALANENVSALVLRPVLAGQVADRAFAIAQDPRLAFFRLYKRLSESGYLQPDLEPARGASCDIHASAFVSDLTSIGDRVTIGPGAMVLDGSCIGDDCFIAPGAIIGAEGMFTLDDETERLRIPHAGGVRLGRNVVVLSQAVIVRSLFRQFTTVGDDSQIGIQTTIGHGARIGRRCVIRGNSVISGRAIVEDEAVVSLSSSVADARRVGEGAEVMMGSVVVSNVEPGATVSGNFAYDHREHVNDYIRRTR